MSSACSTLETIDEIDDAQERVQHILQQTRAIQSVLFGMAQDPDADPRLDPYVIDTLFKGGEIAGQARSILCELRRMEADCREQ